MNKVNHSKNYPVFGMKFKFKRLDPEGDWYSNDREFFNSTYQLGLISGAVSKLKPKSDVFELQLGLPKGDVFADENGILTQSYQMIVNIIKNKKVVNSYDLSENDIKLNSWDYQDKLEVHEKGPCRKVLNFVDELSFEQTTKQ